MAVNYYQQGHVLVLPCPGRHSVIPARLNGFELHQARTCRTGFPVGGRLGLSWVCLRSLPDGHQMLRAVGPLVIVPQSGAGHRTHSKSVVRLIPGVNSGCSRGPLVGDARVCYVCG